METNATDARATVTGLSGAPNRGARPGTRAIAAIKWAIGLRTVTWPEALDMA